jgi:hypothetical protein
MGLGTGFDLGADVIVADGCGIFGHAVVSFGLFRGAVFRD